MEGNARIWFTPKQKAELWERWKNGQCVADIARALERRNKSGVSVAIEHAQVDVAHRAAGRAVDPQELTPRLHSSADRWSE